MWGWGCPKRDLPPINYAEDSEESSEDYESGLNFNSPLTSPKRPLPSREGSPQLLAHPPLRDNVDEELEEVAWKLHDHNQVREEVEELTDLLETTDIKPGFIKSEPELGEEIVDEGVVSAGVDKPLQAPNQPRRIMAVNYDVDTLLEGETEADTALDNALRQLRGKEFEEDDLKFYFNQVEIKMRTAGVKKNYTKFLVLTSILPRKVTDECKALLRKQEDELGTTPYKDLKNRIFKIFGKPANSDFERAMSRVLSGKPSQLANALITDMCDHELNGCCCHKWIFGQWYRALPTSVRQGISHLPFDAAHLDEILELADKLFAARAPSSTSRVAAIASSTNPPTFQTPAVPSSWDSAFHEDFTSEGQVAAIRGNWRGRGRGGFRGSGRSRGNTNQNSRGNTRGGQSARGQAQTHPRHKGPRHPDGPPIESCVKHWTHGKSAHWCQEPGTCPWREYWVPRANNQ